MTLEAKAPNTASIIERAKNILLTPKTEWERIDGEASTIKSIYLGYAMILAAIGPICGLIGSLLFPVNLGIISVRIPIMSAVTSAITSYVLGLAALYVISLVLDALAPNFGGTKDATKAFKLAAYSMTAGWVCGVFSLLLMLGPLLLLVALAALAYGIYLLYLGSTRVMKVAQDKAVTFTAIAAVLMIVVYIVIGWAGREAQAMTMGTMTPGIASMGSPQFTLNGKNGSASINLSQVAAIANSAQAQAAAQQAAANGQPGAATVKPVGADVLSAMLPGTVDGLSRGDISSSSGSAMGMAVSDASATYANGNSHLTLKVTDMGTAAGLAGTWQGRAECQFLRTERDALQEGEHRQWSDDHRGIRHRVALGRLYGHGGGAFRGRRNRHECGDGRSESGGEFCAAEPARLDEKPLRRRLLVSTLKDRPGRFGAFARPGL